MRELTVILDEEIVKAQAELDLEKGKGKEADEGKVEELEEKLGNLQVLKDDYGSFTLVVKKFTLRESITLEEVAYGIRGGVVNIGAKTITNPNILDMKVLAIKYGVKSVEPASVWDVKSEDAIKNMDRTLYEWVYDLVNEFNTKNYKFRPKRAEI